MMFALAGMILILPLLAFLAISLFIRRSDRMASYVSIFAMSCSLLFSIYTFMLMTANPGNYESSLPWINLLANLKIEIGLLLNPLSATMLLVVCAVSFLVQVYSIGYMKGDPGYRKFFAFLSLFSFSMIGLVIANNFLQMYIFWELVGLSSYLLIGFWFNKPEAANAAKKAFIVTRFGDFGFLIAIMILGTRTGTFNFIELQQILSQGIVPAGIITITALLMFMGAVGKSGQFPLHIWLPDAMEGPTPVSALIHAATMVTAGVYLVARAYFLFSMSPAALLVIAGVGGFTALFASSIALVQDDIKKVLAYSTVSQLGYMMLGLGVSGATAGFFHLVTHASFKALLFLCAGSVIHAVGTNNIWEMGGLFKKMKITALTFLVGSIALAGIFPTSGYFSKDAILMQTFNSGQYLLFAMAMLTVAFTAFYMARIFFVVFFSKEKFGSKHPHESPAVMYVPLVILAVLALALGYYTEGFNHFVIFGEIPHEGHSLFIPVLSNIVAIFSIFLAWLIYQKESISAEKLSQRFSGIYRLLKNKYYVDEFYSFCVARILFAISNLANWFDRTIVDGLVNGSSALIGSIAGKLRKTQTGFVQNYAISLFGGVILLYLLIRGFKI